MTIPGVGAITAMAMNGARASCRDVQTGARFAGWVGLSPLQRSTGSKERLNIENG
ncbi:transposase [Mesorhizobium sp.]|uniref:transposase n=1 Tax=Mesorhizobium sp. TaxID=1871066 RepID=UPI00338D4048